MVKRKKKKKLHELQIAQHLITGQPSTSNPLGPASI